MDTGIDLLYGFGKRCVPGRGREKVYGSAVIKRGVRTGRYTDL